MHFAFGLDRSFKPYRRAAILWNFFRETMAGAVFAGTARRHIAAAEKPCLAARKMRASVLPAVRRNEITCLSCCERALPGRRSLSASRGFGFRGLMRGELAARRANMPDKCFSLRWNLARRTAAHGVAPSKPLYYCAFSSRLACQNPRKSRASPPSRRNVPEVCRKTRRRARASPGTPLKSFN
jgi:hypothetical protein